MVTRCIHNVLSWPQVRSLFLSRSCSLYSLRANKGGYRAMARSLLGARCKVPGAHARCPVQGAHARCPVLGARCKVPGPCHGNKREEVTALSVQRGRPEFLAGARQGGRGGEETGGLSFPGVGTDGTGHRILQKCGHSLHPTYPALTPLTGPHPGGQQLAGVSMNIALQCSPGAEAEGASEPRGKASKRRRKKARKAQRTGMVFTHKGYSGPSVLDLSHHAVKALERRSARPQLHLDWTGEGQDVWRQRLEAKGKGLVATRLKRHLPARLVDALMHEAGLEDRNMSELRKGERLQLLEMLSRYELPYTGHQGYKKAEVTGGGVPLDEINISTMESRVLPGVYLCGEVCDVFGRIGGFNFYWAWVSGRLAGLGVAAPSIQHDA
eukprot:gene2578-biopygen2508